MKRRHLIFFLIIFIALSSCNLPGTPPTPVDIATIQPTVDIPVTGINTSATPTVEMLVDVVGLPTPIFTATSSTVLASAREQPVNCRFGPNISYAVIGALIVGRHAEVIGKNPDITWVYVRNPSDPSTSCWLSTEFVNVEGNLEDIPVVGAPEIMVTKIDVRIDPPAMSVACDAFPQSVIISADITTNGPLIVTWYWESNTGHTAGQKQLLFEASDTKTVQDYFQVDRVGDYSILARTAPPNSQVGEGTFKVVCTP